MTVVAMSVVAAHGTSLLPAHQAVIVGGVRQRRSRTSCVLVVISALVSWSTAAARDFLYDDGNSRIPLRYPASEPARELIR